MLVTGGHDGSNDLSSTEIYLNSQWSFAASLPTPRRGSKASIVRNTVYVSGKYVKLMYTLLLFSMLVRHKVTLFLILQEVVIPMALVTP